MKVIVTGANGMLGSSIVKFFKNKYDVIGYDKKGLDVTDIGQIIEVINDEDPNIIIHTAANTDAEYCERNPEKAYLINTSGTENIIKSIAEKNSDITMVFISSTGVYGNLKDSPYIESDEVNPTSVHHKSKYFGEQSIYRLRKYLIIRTGWLFGGRIENKKNFVYNRYLEAVKKDLIYSDFQQKGNPTYTKDLCDQIDYLLHAKLFGLFNAVGIGVATRYEYVQEIISCFGLSCTIERVSHKNFQRVAPVPLNESAYNHKLELAGIDIMRPWKESLLEYISLIKEQIATI
jgi:dTDP-4-dehydrorhamnose reductase|tara:strand:+ start:139 stop:1008 length:870 start_codon:yes stop_codon:yes gene_type:complete